MKTPEQQSILAAEILGWRRWKFGDPWRKGLRLADQRFNGFIRLVIADANADSEKVELDIDEAWTQKVSEVLANYIPVSHWVLEDEIRSRPPAFHTDANASLQLVEWMAKKKWRVTIKRFVDGAKGNWICDVRAVGLHQVKIADTLPLAVLGAFLRANGKEVE